MRGREPEKAAEGEIRPKSLRQKNRAQSKNALESRGKPRAEGVSATDRVPVVRVSQASDRGAHHAVFCGVLRFAGGSMNEELKKLPLNELHEKAGAKFGSFAGWSMPLSYPDGVMKEHLHTRKSAGLFDISHMRLLEVSGPGAAALLERCCPIEAALQKIGTAKYTLLLNEDAGIVDDLIVTRRGDETFMVVANAGRADIDTARFSEQAEHFDCSVEILDRVFLALQGPQAVFVLKNAGIDSAGLHFMESMTTKAGWIINRSGYTGEDGFEIAIPLADAAGFAGLLLSDERVMWIGLAARDSLRLEAGLCLYGQDLTEETDPVSARLMWAIPERLRDNGDFVGAHALRAIREKGPHRVRVGILPGGRQPVRADTPLYGPDGKPAGIVTSGGFGPSADHPVSMGYIDKKLSVPGTSLEAEIRGKRVAVSVASLPFVPHHYYKG